MSGDGAVQATPEQMSQIQAMLASAGMTDGAKAPEAPEDQHHAFWETQPVAQFNDDATAAEDGPIDKPLTVADVKPEPYNLPASFEWTTCDMADSATNLEVYNLLTQNYVEDDDNMFRFDYSAPFLNWALMPPGYKKEWHVGVRVSATKKLVAFITGIPATININGKAMPMAEINFLCVHKKLRAKRLAPVLIKEITRRVNLCDIWQASYTAGVVLPKPVATCRYWHRSLNPKKLVDVGFSRLQPRMTMSRTVKLYKMPDDPATPGFRQMRDGDVPQVTALLKEYLGRDQFRLHPELDEAEVRHWLLPRENVVNAFVVEGRDGKITDFVSYYTLPSTIIGNPQYKTLKAAYSYYNVANSISLHDLMTDALIKAQKDDFDVFNALDVMENVDMLRELKFGIGDGNLQYYLYNWRVAQELTPQQVGLVLL